MSKKQTNLSNEVLANEPLQEAQLNEQPKNNKKNNNNSKKNPNKKPNFFQRIGRTFKEMFSEMKKVTWLKPKETVTRWGVVLLVVAIFLLIIMGFDALCNYLLSLLIPAMA